MQSVVAGVMAQWLRVLTLPLKDSSLVPTLHLLKRKLYRIFLPFLTFLNTLTYGHFYTHTETHCLRINSVIRKYTVESVMLGERSSIALNSGNHSPEPALQ